MNEIELKFQIPLTEQKRLYQWFLSKNARSVALYAKYYDTPERHLAQQHICLRQRLQGKTWIQTSKTINKPLTQSIKSPHTLHTTLQKKKILIQSWIMQTLSGLNSE